MDSNGNFALWEKVFLTALVAVLVIACIWVAHISFTRPPRMCAEYNSYGDKLDSYQGDGAYGQYNCRYAATKE